MKEPAFLNRVLAWPAWWRQTALFGGSLIVWALLHGVLVAPLQRDSVRLGLEAQTLKTMILQAERRASGRAHTQGLCRRLEAHVQALKTHFGLDGRRERDFQALSGLSHRCGLELSGFRPLPGRASGTWMLLPMEVEMAGSFSAMNCMAHHLSRLPRLLLAGDFTLEDSGLNVAGMARAPWLRLRLQLFAFHARKTPSAARALPQQAGSTLWWPEMAANSALPVDVRDPFVSVRSVPEISAEPDTQEQDNLPFVTPENKRNASHVRAADGMQTGFVQVRFAKAADLALLISGKGALLSPEGRCGADPRTNIFWVQDTRTHVENVQNMIKRLDVPVRQVLIEARIVNINRDYAEDIGVRLGMGEVLDAGNVPQVPPPGARTGAFPGRLNVDLLALSGSMHPASVGLAMAKLGTGVLLDMELSALESEGRGHVVASPRLVTANLEPAVIESGEEIPYQEATVAGATAVTFKKAVLSLRVTPRIAPDNTIYMALQINQDTPSRREVQNVPAVLTREIRTSVQVNNGQTVVLGGIHQQGQIRDLQQVPFLGSLPVVGGLFRKTATKIRNEELLIFITPRIIAGGSPGYQGGQGDGVTLPVARAKSPAAGAFAVSLRDSDSCKQGEVCNQR